MNRFVASTCLAIFALGAKADPLAQSYYANDKGAVLYVEALDDQGFDFSLISHQDCPEGETSCLMVEGRAEATAKGWTYSDGSSRIFFAATGAGVRILQTAGDLGAGTANRAAKLSFPGDFNPVDVEADAAPEDPGMQDYRMIRSPTGNIGCILIVGEDDAARCDLAELVPSFTRQPQDCEFDYGSAFGIMAGQAKGEALCYSDTVLDPGAEVLDYGSSITLGDITCRSEKTGMTCENSLGHGFTVSRKKQVVY